MAILQNAGVQPTAVAATASTIGVTGQTQHYTASAVPQLPPPVVLPAPGPGLRPAALQTHPEEPQRKPNPGADIANELLSLLGQLHPN